MKSKIIMKIIRYSNSKQKDWSIYPSGEKLRYILREEAILKHSRKPENQNISNYLQKTRLENPENSGLMYFDFRNKTLNYPTLEEAEKNFSKLDPNQFVWDGVISISKDEANNLNFGTQKDFAELIQRYIPSFLKVEGLDPENVNFYAAVHSNTNNPHLHFIFFENEKSIYDEKTKQLIFKKKGKLKISNIKKFENLTWNYLTEKEKSNEIFLLKQEFWSNKNEIKNELKAIKFEKMNSYALSIVEEIKQNNIKNYKNLSETAKLLVQHYFNEQLEELDIGIQTKYDNHIKFLEKYPNNEHFQKEQINFENWIGNKIIKDLTESYLEEYDYSDHKNNIFKKQKHFKPNHSNLSSFLNLYDYHNKQYYLNQFREIQQNINNQKRNISNSS